MQNLIRLENILQFRDTVDICKANDVSRNNCSLRRSRSPSRKCAIDSVIANGQDRFYEVVQIRYTHRIYNILILFITLHIYIYILYI